MTKHAVLVLSHAAKFAGWDDGVRVTALCPGAVETDLIAGLAGATPAAGRMKPETVAHTVSFLLTLPDTASVAELPMNTRLEFDAVAQEGEWRPREDSNLRPPV